MIAGHYIDRRRAQQMVDLQAQPHEPRMGEPSGLIWRVDKTDEGYEAVGRSLAELKELAV